MTEANILRESPALPVDSAQLRETSLLDLAYDAVFERDFETDIITTWNRSAEILYGWSAEEAIGQTPHELLETVFPRPVEEIKETLARAGRWEGELIHRTRSGQQIVVRSRWAATTPVGMPQSILEVNSDITERKRAEAERAQLAAIVDSSSDAIIGKTLDGIVTSWNAGAERMYGYTLAEIVGKPITTIFPPDSGDEFDRIMSQLRAGRAIENYETRRVRKDGTFVNVSLSISPIKRGDGTIIGAATIARDITEWKRIEAERTGLLQRERQARTQAERAQRRLTFLAEASGVLASSLDYEATLANVARMAVPHVADWCAVHVVDDAGAERRLAVMHVNPEKIESALEMERRYPPDADANNATSRVIRSGEPLLVSHITDEMIAAAAQSPEHERVVSDLELSSLMIVPLTARGRVFGVITFATDQPDRHYDEDDLALATDLARRAGAAVDNARLYAEVQEALRLREEFLSIASHELKTPLTALQLQAQLLRRYLRRGEPMPLDAGTKVIDAVERQVKRLTRLTNDLLDVSRIASGRFQLEREELDLGGLVREVVDRFAEEIESTGVALTLIAPSGVRGMWDRHRLDQVVANLLANAIKYGRGNPIRIVVEAREEWAVLEVADEGVGIPPEQISRIFDRFERIETSERSGGLGLGLYIVQEIVQAHGGKVTVESQVGTGTRFRVELPRS